MGILWRLFAPKSLKKARRSVRKARHPVRTVNNAVTPRPIKKVRRAVAAVAHPLEVAECGLENQVVRAARGGSRKRRRTEAANRSEAKQTIPPVSAAAPAGARTKGLTSEEFDGISLPTLRAWLKFYGDRERSTDAELEKINAESGHDGFSREDHARVIQAEIDAREAERSQGR